MNRLHLLGQLIPWLALGFERDGYPSNQPTRLGFCANPDCHKASGGATYCSRECRDYFKAHFRCEGGRNVRITLTPESQAAAAAFTRASEAETGEMGVVGE